MATRPCDCPAPLERVPSRPGRLRSAIERFWLGLTCRSHELQLSDEAARAFHSQAARCPNVGVGDFRELFVFKCGHRLQLCEACPRFQAHRQALAAQGEPAVGDAMNAYCVLIVEPCGTRHETLVIAQTAQQAEDIAIQALRLEDAPRWVRTRRAR